jgi:hypothetical protein
MQGYILAIQKVREEDLIVTILTKDELLKLYRFYGVRHSILNIGNKIDFEIEVVSNSNNKRLRSVIHLADVWQLQFDKMLFWQKYLILLHKHLSEIHHLDPFYYTHLEKINNTILRQNVKRVLINGYIDLLYFEGRDLSPNICFLCDEAFDKECSIQRGFLATHSYCQYGKKMTVDSFNHMMQTKKCLHLSESNIELLWSVILEGL